MISDREKLKDKKGEMPVSIRAQRWVHTANKQMNKYKKECIRIAERIMHYA